MEAPFIGMWGLPVFEIVPVMTVGMFFGAVLVGIALPCHLVLSVRIGWFLLMGSASIGFLLIDGPTIFAMRHFPLLMVLWALPCWAVGWWQLHGMAGIWRQLCAGARWLWSPVREKPGWRV